MSPSRVLRLTEQAEDDLADIWAFIAQDNPAAATSFVHKLQKRFEPLCDHPELGPRRDELAPGLRVHLHRDYAIYYRHSETEIVLIRVLQGSRDARALFARDDIDG